MKTAPPGASFCTARQVPSWRLHRNETSHPRVLIQPGRPYATAPSGSVIPASANRSCRHFSTRFAFATCGWETRAWMRSFAAKIAPQVWKFCAKRDVSRCGLFQKKWRKTPPSRENVRRNAMQGKG